MLKDRILFVSVAMGRGLAACLPLFTFSLPLYHLCSKTFPFSAELKSWWQRVHGEFGKDYGMPVGSKVKRRSQIFIFADFKKCRYFFFYFADFFCFLIFFVDFLERNTLIKVYMFEKRF